MEREEREFQEALERTRKELYVAKKGEEKSRSACKNAQSLKFQFQTKDREANNFVSGAQDNVVSSRARYV